MGANVLTVERMSRAFLLFAAVSFTAGSDCGVHYEDYDKGESSDTGESDADADADADGDADADTDADCEGTAYTAGIVQYDWIQSICVSGTSPVGVPENFEVTVPAAGGEYLAFGTWEDYDSSTDTFEISVNKDPSGELVYRYGDDGFEWPYRFDPDCADYDINSVNFFYVDGYSYLWSGFGPTCDDNPPALPAPPAPAGRVSSGSQACSAGEADFDMAVRRVYHADETQATMWLSPVATDVVSFPERAWLRSLEVVDWGSAINLHLADSFVVPLEVDGWDLDGTVITPAVTGPTIVTYGVGVKPMGIMMGTSHFDLTDSTVSLPKLHLEWTCEVNGSNPHPIAVAGHTGHVVSLPEASPIKNRIVFWVSNDGSRVRVAPEGRYLDYIESDLTTSGSGGKTFTVPLPGYHAVFTGRLVPFGGSYKLHDGLVTHPSGTVGITTKTLTAL